MAKPKCYFIPERAFPFLSDRANELEFLGSSKRISGKKQLAEAGIFPGVAENVYKYLNGEYPIPQHLAESICKKLKISPEDWESITEWRTGDLKSAIHAYFKNFQDRGLSSVVTFTPRSLVGSQLSSFCVSARVVTEEEWNSITYERAGQMDPARSDWEEIVGRKASGVLLNTWLTRQRRRVVLKGEPGEGKTTAIFLYASELCGKWLSLPTSSNPEDDGLDVPLILPLSQVLTLPGSGTALLDLAIEYMLGVADLPIEQRSEVKSWLGRMVVAGRFVLLLDAFDELRGESLLWLQEELARLEGACMVMSTRYHADPRAVMRGFVTLRMVPLRWHLIEDYILRYFSEASDGARQANAIRGLLRVNSGLRQLVQNPLLLAVICFLRDDDESSNLPATRAGLLELAIRSLQRRGDRRRGFVEARTSRDQKKLNVLCELAWRFQAQQPMPMGELELQATLEDMKSTLLAAGQLEASDLLREFVEDGILVRRGQGPFNFLLRRFHEYCLARRIVRVEGLRQDGHLQRLLRARFRDWNRTYRGTEFRPINQPAWWEVWPLIAGMPECPPDILEACLWEHEHEEDLVDGRLRLLATVLGEYLRAHSEESSSGTRWKGVAERVIAKLLDKTVEEPVILNLPGNWRSLIARFPIDLTFNTVVGRIRASKNDTRVVNACSMCLGEIGSVDAREVLRECIGSHDYSDEMHATQAISLGLIGDSASRNTLVQWLNSKEGSHKYLRFGCVVGLAHVADHDSREALVGQIHDPNGDSELRWQAIKECERLFGPEVETELLAVVQQSLELRNSLGKRVREREDDDEVIKQCVQILGRIGTPCTATVLLKFLDSPIAKTILRHICNAVASIGDSKAREALRLLVLDPNANKNVSNYAALALVQVGDSEMLPYLLEAAERPSCPPQLRVAVAEACGEGHGDLVFAFLKRRLLGNDPLEVKKAAAMTLAYLGGPFALDALKCTLASGPEDDLAFECARGLVANGCFDHEAILLKGLQDPTTALHLRLVAAHSLAKSTSDRARNALLNMVQDETQLPPVKNACAQALGTLARETGWRALVKGGWESP